MLEIVRDYQYLGLIFNYNEKFNKAEQKLHEKGTMAMFSLLCKVRSLFLPLDLLLKLFNHIVVPIIISPVILWPFFGEPQDNCNRRFFTAKLLISIPRMTFKTLFQ